MKFMKRSKKRLFCSLLGVFLAIVALPALSMLKTTTLPQNYTLIPMLRSLLNFHLIKLVIINPADIITQEISQWFNVAKTAQTCILIINNFDLLTLDGVGRTFLSDFLQELNDTDGHAKHIIIIGLAKKIGNIDSAIIERTCLKNNNSGSRMFFIINSPQMASLNMGVNLNCRKVLMPQKHLQ